ncbi:MAG: VOC family protein [Caulobacterales bacterium]
MNQITPCLWFDTQAEEAARFYVSLFANSRIGAVSRYGDAGPMPKGTALSVAFEIDGRPFIALNGGPAYKLTEAFSLQVSCEGQVEVDRYWNTLSEGGEPGRCGWLKDRFGLSWQIVPTALPRLMGDLDPARARRVTEAMLKMGRLDIAGLEAAAAG